MPDLYQLYTYAKLLKCDHALIITPKVNPASDKNDKSDKIEYTIPNDTLRFTILFLNLSLDLFKHDNRMELKKQIKSALKKKEATGLINSAENS